jgi:hypothetical protein
VLPVKRRRRGRWLFGLVVLVVLGAVAYGAWTALSLRSHLASANTEAHDLRTAIIARNEAAARRSFTDLSNDLQAAHNRADSPAWAVTKLLPGIGDDAKAVAAVADAGNDLTHGALRRLVQSGDWQLVDNLTPQHGRVDVGAIKKLAPTVAGLSRDFTRARQLLAGIDSQHLSSWVRPSFDNARSQVDQTAGPLAAADRAFRVLPAMLGADGPRTWLLVFGNNAEIRATGGLPGAVALVRTDHGKISLGRQASAGDFPMTNRPVLPPTPAERTIYHDQPGTYFQDANFIPEFPRTAQLWRTWWQQRYGQQVDGVASIDTVTLSYLLRATGPVTVDGVQLTADNATDELLHRTYERLPTNDEQNAFFADVAKTMFATVTNGAGSPADLVRAVSQGVTEGRIYVHSFHGDAQRVLQPTSIAGTMDFAKSAQPQLGIWLNDGTGSKMSYYLRTNVRATSNSCAGGRQTLTMSVRFTSTAPQDASKLPLYITGGGNFGIAKGHQLVVANVYGPAGGELSAFTFDGRKVPVPSVEDRGRPVATPVVDLAPGQTTTITFRVTTGIGDRGATELTQGPGMEPRPARTTIPTSCG